jgi:uncharacterized membrane protein HdeD (DUF308 family)
MSIDQFAENPFAAGINEIRSSWAWFFAFGTLLMLLGATCIVYSFTATAVTIAVMGWLLLIGAVFALIQAFRVHNWSGFFLYFLGALLRGFTGYVLIRYPDVGASAMTLVLASFFIVGGLFRGIVAAMLKFPRWGWATLSGVLAFALGIMLLVQWPVTSLWFIGFAIGVDMIFDGAAFTALAMAIHTLPKLTPYKTKPA